MKVAALFVDPRGCYAGLPDVEMWDEKRDARLYQGPYPVVAHPPCSRWCRLAGLVEARWGHKRGDDGGCFAADLAAVRRWGGVLEHPAYSDAWKAFDLPRPPYGGGWVGSDQSGWSCEVQQDQYGHQARKRTWLYAFGCDLPELRWTKVPDSKLGPSGWRDSRVPRSEMAKALVSFCANRTKPNDDRPRLTKKQAIATPPEFRDLLLSMARSVKM